ncbi:hypothetical protein CUT44_30945 [Streptomyces carminius]|uniref:Uncharacterized protein n=1 Tax=Streptomyces carminius TaxID=2665496 RepID=A0A2M8LPU8_9ACTN|nr:hypothetical protein [Streptomyces carminius]PJE93965.1 hypothetical protein CUT44_30945 [Streptomyces carminius]
MSRINRPRRLWLWVPLPPAGFPGRRERGHRRGGPGRVRYGGRTRRGRHGGEQQPQPRFVGTRSTAAVNSAQPRTPTTDSKRPAIDSSPLSSCGKEDRTTRGVFPSPASSDHSSRYRAHSSAGSVPASTRRLTAVVRTNPGRVGRPAAAEAARAAALPPHSAVPGTARRLPHGDESQAIKSLTSK